MRALRKASPRLRPHTVTLFIFTWGTDPDAGPLEASAQQVLGVRCSVEAGEPELVIDDHTGRWTQITPCIVRFSSDPGLKAMDVIQWVDGSRVHKIVVGGVIDRAGRNATWEVRGVEKL